MFESMNPPAGGMVLPQFNKRPKVEYISRLISGSVDGLILNSLNSLILDEV